MVSGGSLWNLYGLTKDPRIIAGQERFCCFMSYNMLLEPAGGLINNRSMSTRLEFPVYSPVLRPWSFGNPLGGSLWQTHKYPSFRICKGFWTS